MRIEGVSSFSPGFDGDDGFSGPLSRSWSGGLGSPFGWAKRRARAAARLVRARKMMLLHPASALWKAQYRIAKGAAKVAARGAAGAGRAVAKAAASGGGGGGPGDEAPAEEAPAEEEAPDESPGPSEEPAEEAPAEEMEGLAGVIETGARMMGLGDDAPGVAGLFSGTGEPRYLPLGKLGTPLAVLAAWFGWKKIRKGRRR